ncbi:phosphodiester glycosidase family protein [Streptomyces sp. NPDC059740]|uniref:phosphodiester glycosidase family protein n=1 Tax=Streptomyces sp. NPDC059740 TaxID=3346926 RepID=UPI0036613506
MRKRYARARAALTLVATWAVLAGAGVADALPATAAAEPVRATGTTVLAPGIRYTTLDLRMPGGTAHAHLLTADLRVRHVTADLLTPGAVARRGTVSAMADARGAVAAVNGDFFNIEESQHPGVEPTGSADGPAVSSGRVLKSAVPDGQRFGPALPAGTSTRDVFVLGTDRRARLDELTLRGTVRTPHGVLRLGGLNQYAVPVGGVGAYTAAWGATSRARAVCGTDTVRAAPCTTDAYEVTVRRGRVVATAESPGAGAVAGDSVVLVGREGGAQALRALHRGDRVAVSAALRARTTGRLKFAVGGFPVLRGGLPLPDLDTGAAAVRTAIGTGSDGRTLYLLGLDGATGSARLTVAQLAEVMRELGAADAMNLDGGGSTEVVERAPGSHSVTVVNHPSDGAERPVAEAVGLFAGRG